MISLMLAIKFMIFVIPFEPALLFNMWFWYKFLDEGSSNIVAINF